MHSHKKLWLGVFIGSLLGATTLTHADGSRFYINAALGMQFFDSDRDLDDAATYSLGGEYRFNDSWATELRYLYSDPDADEGGSVDVNQYYLDGLYYFNGMWEKWQPFVVLGAGYADFDGGRRDSNETQANAGVGVRYSLNDNWSLRGDVRGIYGFDDETVDSLVNIGISYAFGEKKKAVVQQAPAAAATAAVVDGDGDGDGVKDSRDRCLNTPSGSAVNAEGCILTRDKEVSFDLSLRFGHDSAVLEKYDSAEVEKISNYLNANPKATAVVEGHSDDTGAAAYNKGLSQRRAEAVVKLLTGTYKVDPARLTAMGYGEERPIADNTTAAGRDANRRVVVKVRNTVEEPVQK